MAAAIFATLAILASQGLMGCVLGNPIDVEATTTTREYVEKLCLDEATGERLNEQLVISVATKLNQDIDINCEDHVRDAFGDLSDIIKETRTSGCNRESVEAIAKYLPKAPKFSQFWQTLPREMYVFAIDYAMGMSKHCKQVMARVLLNNKQLEERDFSALERWTKKDSYVDQLIKRMSNIGLVSPGDVTAVIPDASILFKAININPESEPESVKIIRAVCSKRYKPVYEQVVAPVHLLSRAGIDYPNEHLMEEEMSDDDEAREKFELWNRIVLLCDTADLEQSFNHENTNGTPIVAPNQEIELVDGQYESSSESNEEEDDDESEFEQLAGEPVEQEGMSNRVEQLAEEEIERLISEIVEERRNPISRLTHKFIDAASELAMDLIEHGDIQRLIKCIRRESLSPTTSC